MAALRTDPHAAFTVEELCVRIYRVPPVRQHRSSVLRAMRGLAMSVPWIAPLETVSGLGAAIYTSGSAAGGQLARAKLAFLDASRYRIYPKALEAWDETWLTWARERHDLPILDPKDFTDRPEILVGIEKLKLRYSLSFQDTVALLAILGFNALEAEKPGNRYTAVLKSFSE
jgi:hypothetical protein